MTYKISLWKITVIVGLLALPPSIAAQHTDYRFVDLGTFGGPESYINPAEAGAPNQINPAGTVVGASATMIPIAPDSNLSICGGVDGLVPFVTHGFRWQNGVVTDLGALPGEDTCAVATSINARGEIVGQSENGEIDSLLGLRQVRAVLWQDGRIRNLGTFGGNHSYVSNINNHGQVAGYALNAIPDPFSFYYLFLFDSSNGTQTRAFLWENEHKQDLGTLGGPDAFAGFVNERGQVAGFSYTDSIPTPTTGIPTLHAFLWESGSMIDLGTLGGTQSEEFGLNNRGQVIGASTLEGDGLVDPFLWEHGKLIDLFTGTKGGSPLFVNAINDAGEIVGGGTFGDRPVDALLWRKGVATDLGFLASDCFSNALALNSKGQIVGESISCDGTTPHGVLWEHGLMLDLQSLVPPNANFRIADALAVSESGVIGGIGEPQGCNAFQLCGHAYLLIPCGDDGNDQNCRDGNTAPVIRSTSSMLNRKLGEMADLTPRQIADRIHTKFGRNRGLAGLRIK